MPLRGAPDEPRPSDEDIEFLYARVQLARVNAQDAIVALDAILAAPDQHLSEAASAAEFARRIREGAETAETKELGRHADAIAEALAHSDCLTARAGDAGQRMRNHIIDGMRHWPITAEPRDSALAAAKRARDHLAAAVFEAGRMTVPRRLRQHLETVRVGRALDFNNTFADELPDRGDRDKVLHDLSAHANFAGVVDEPHGLVWKKHPSRWVRMASYLSPLFFAGLCFGLLVVIGLVHWPESLHLDNGGALCAAFALVLTGSVLHLVVENVKLSQADNPPVLAIGDFLDWLHLRWAGLAASFFPMLVTVIGLRVASNVGTSGDALLVWLFAGYSSDSIAGVFLTRFKAVAGGQAAALTKSVQDTPGGPVLDPHRTA